MLLYMVAVINLVIKETHTRISVTVPKEVYLELLELSELDDRSISSLILAIIKVHLNKKKKKH